VAVLVLIGLLITGLGTAALYYALWKGMVQSFKGTWASASSDTRRQIVKSWVFMAVLMIVVATLLIASPFGPADTVLFVFGGTGVLLFLCLNGYVILLVKRNRRK
jgi:hypothetical protein